jgi:hypothetical protein
VGDRRTDRQTGLNFRAFLQVLIANAPKKGMLKTDLLLKFVKNLATLNDLCKKKIRFKLDVFLRNPLGRSAGSTVSTLS